MRNPERIDKVCEALSCFWKEFYPDMRLGQLMWMIAGRDPFFIEDYDALKSLAKRAGSDIDLTDFPEYYIEPNGWNKVLDK